MHATSQGGPSNLFLRYTLKFDLYDNIVHSSTVIGRSALGSVSSVWNRFELATRATVFLLSRLQLRANLAESHGLEKPSLGWERRSKSGNELLANLDDGLLKIGKLVKFNASRIKEADDL